MTTLGPDAARRDSTSRRRRPGPARSRLSSARLAPDATGSSETPLVRLFLFSVTTLFVEILLIRWIGTEIRIFAYFQNLALIACFLGFGLGCYWSERRKPVLVSAGAMIVIAGIVVLPDERWRRFLEAVSSRLALSSDASIWGSGPAAAPATAWLLTVASIAVVAGLLLLLVTAMVPLGQWVGHELDHAEDAVRAYTVNLLGSVIGLWLMALLAFHWLPPAAWLALALLLLLVSRRTSWPTAALAIALMTGLLVLLRLSGTGPESLVKRPLEGEEKRAFWSPYQKLEVSALGPSEYLVDVNNVGYMTIARVPVPGDSGLPGPLADAGDDSYSAPFRFVDAREDVLVVGAGAGNDVAAALAYGAERVDAVEIDPLILEIGKLLNPGRPYQSARVRTIVNDARNFMSTTDRRYDVIVFGLLDSHTQFSDFSNMRVDNYVYTEESFRQARRLLKPEGVLVVKFEVRAPWLWMGQRFASMLTGIFGRPPIAFYAPPAGKLLPATVFLASDGTSLYARSRTASTGALRPPSFPPASGAGPIPATDDWPYVYNRDRTVPPTYRTVSVILLAITLLLVRGSFQPRKAETWPFFFLGAGFMLLETQLVSRLALYFGTTWVVNSVAITVLLVVLVLANAFVRRFRPGRLARYAVPLLLSLLANFFVPWEAIPLPVTTVGIFLSAAYAVPVFFAGILFTEMFRRAERKANAFGANIVGAVLGGLVQNVSFIFGMRALVLVCTLFYLAAVVSAAGAGRRRTGASSALPQPAAAS